VNLTVQPPFPFLFVGNHPCLDFINTELMINGQASDLLPSFQDLLGWLVQAGLLAEAQAKQIERRGGSQAVETLRQAKVFRATMRDMVARLADDGVPQTALAAINHLLHHRVGYPQISRRGETFEQKYEAGSENVNQVLGLLAEAASDLLCNCDLLLVKKCQNPACVLFFYDTTKNHARHWCSMSLCGNRSKVAAHYRRQRGRKK
jgi:predicted RNA-binding Zn ribbon-like protein